MNRIGKIILALAVLVAIVFVGRARAASAIGGGTISNVAVSFNPTTINLNPDGSFTVGVTVNLNGTARPRSIGVSADGLTFTLDGAPLTPWTALTNLGSSLATAGPKVTQVFQAAGAVAPLTGP